MGYILAATIIIWSSVYAFVMPSSVDKELSNKDNIAAIHKIDYPSE